MRLAPAYEILKDPVKRAEYDLSKLKPTWKQVWGKPKMRLVFLFELQSLFCADGCTYRARDV